jgi:23S rRNA (uracil1939-C5)-methyltransferase
MATFCPFFPSCGGCQIQDLDYSAQVELKAQKLHNLFDPLVPENKWLPFLYSPSSVPQYFRNKIRYGFLAQNGVISGSRHEVGDFRADIAINQCFLQSPTSVQILNLTADFATQNGWQVFTAQTNQKKVSGWLKHLLVREGKKTGEFLISLVTTETEIPNQKEWIEKLTTNFPNLKSIYQTKTKGKDNSQSQDFHLWGALGIKEMVGQKQFFISPHAFFQTNGEMVDQLYKHIESVSQLQSTDFFWDLYAGSATIGIYLSGLVKEVISIENNPQNIADAQQNIELNKVFNLKLLAGDVATVLDSHFINTHPRPSVIVLDPPRAGLAPALLNILPALGRHRLIYVSCNPKTCLEDCAKLVKKGYQIDNICGIDMFPHSQHVECVLSLKKA